ncbi:HAMP domain-containing histidine kinase [Corynebacterium sp. MC-04]|uniref:histidine kinase n=1 Tax=Corynebacterium parakroppenstedtii TaxID=2828363 RepID=A0ABS9HN22_9CORY|nr:HAMP domain-containing sensor histidine kinase [Corynebacterium parakroppenstedtii]KXB50117.1 ATPase/histidine kinase/DNA gyrase B/HSP90 domain protein [Corynebacterium kroppenstedtii]MCZ9303800.1 HAMP domain-containing histidine kinase [Corynebacterium sp. c24U_166]MCF6770315.1 HAMP domain-containing histidine kinase [Corynebacterium parakroppenstedtii]MCF6772433.1 HAMP domain-containing histidine kinase [Corynebacterium parakroppenstedtii]MCF6774649.1 HAMP domain-containing histidine kina
MLHRLKKSDAPNDADTSQSVATQQPSTIDQTNSWALPAPSSSEDGTIHDADVAHDASANDDASALKKSVPVAPPGRQTTRPRSYSEKRRQEWERKQHTGAAKRGLSRLPLHTSLIIIVMVISAGGMFFTGLAVTSTLREFMQSRIDASLESTAHSPFIEQGRLPVQSAYSENPRLPSQYFVQVTHSDGSVVSYDYGFESYPNLDSVTHETGPVTVSAARGSKSTAHWRAMALKSQDGDLVVVAVSLDDNERTISRLFLLEAGLGMLVLAVLLILTWYVVRRSLRPLSHVERVAGKIADGDLSQRLPEWPPDTEVGALSRSLNKMLAQIEQSFVAVERSEAEAQENARVARKAEAQAREAEQTMRRFIGDASHELRTPLTSVSGYAELYRTGQTDDLNLVLDSISAEAERMSVLVQDLLDLARMDNSRPLEHKSVDILSVAISVIQNMKVNYPDRDISMTNNCVEPPIVTGDSARLHQVLTNLMTNALKHAGPEAAVRIALDDSTLGTSPKKKAVRIRVIDNGVGIPPEDSEHIFERFYRADSSRSRHQGGGSGLGLSIVQGLVEQHGGKVTVDSVVDEGTTFTVLLPHE